MTRKLADYPQVTPEQVQKVFEYNPDFGCLLRINKSNGYKRIAGHQAEERGEVRTYWNGVYWPTHLLVWIHQFNTWPEAMPVHRDGDRGNNLIINLTMQSTIDREKAEIKQMLSDQYARVAAAAGVAPGMPLPPGVVAAPGALLGAFEGVFAKAMSGHNAGNV